MNSAQGRGDDLGLYSPAEVSKQIDIARFYGYDLVERKQEGEKVRLFGIRTPAAIPSFKHPYKETLEN